MENHDLLKAQETVLPRCVPVTQGADLLAQIQSLVLEYQRLQTSDRSFLIPIECCSVRNLGIVESVVKFLKEDMGLRFVDIATQLNRDQRSVWVSYNRAAKKHPQRFRIKSGGYWIPTDIFQDKTLSPLEVLVIYLNGSAHLSLAEISRLLARDYGTIWITKRNANKKKKRPGKPKP